MIEQSMGPNEDESTTAANPGKACQQVQQECASKNETFEAVVLDLNARFYAVMAVGPEIDVLIGTFLSLRC